MTAPNPQEDSVIYRAIGMCPWCGRPLEGHPKRCENDD